LKIYTATSGDIPLLTSAGWTPPLRLSAHQQEVQESSGTVLVLGRAGTGKTVCLCDRMTRDRQAAAVHGHTLSQLFVSRSKRLCEFVKTHQEQQSTDGTDLASTDFITLDQFMCHMETTLSTSQSTAFPVLSPIRRVDYQRFCSLMADALQCSGLDAIVVWTQ